MILRPATADDLPALAQLGTDAFVAKFGHLYKAEDLASFLAEYRTVEAYRRQLAEPGIRIQLAEDDGVLLGYCLIVLGKGFDERPLPHPAKPVTLSQLYCAPAALGRGTGSALMEWIMAEVRAWGADAVQLSVYAENRDAQRFYHRYGFEKAADMSFWVGNHRDPEFLFELKF
jgi:ribosomal protein S18 acetylase RimI-like enzyme